MKRAVKLNLVETPKVIDFESRGETLEVIGNYLTTEINQYGWSKECTTKLLENPITLFLYDQFEYYLAKAFGSKVNDVKIALNPLMVQCLHPKCISTCVTPVKLKKMFGLKPYLDHLKNHYDQVGISMQKRFTSAYADKFITVDQLNSVADSPYSLMNNTIKFGGKSIETYEKYAIHRKFTETYICHWKNHMVCGGVIDSSSLSFQEDDARIYMTLHYPNPVDTWNRWKTIYWFSIKMLASNDASALNLYRGVTDYPKLSRNKELTNTKTFNRKLNHPGPGLTTVDSFFPKALYSPEQYHRREILFHLQVLKNTQEALKISYDDSCTSFPITLGADDQEINPGSFIDDTGGFLLGLERSLTADDIRSIGVKNLGHHIASSNNYVTSVREYRATDFKGCMNSNISTSFIAGSFKEEKCTDSLTKVTNWVNMCSNCLSSGLESCEYEKIYNKCEKCERDGLNCNRMIVFNVLWDMGSSHKSVAKNIKKIDVSSSDKDFVTSNLHSVSFGGLHLCKCVVNAARCYNMSYKGEKFGVYILRSLRHGSDECAALLSKIKNAVIVCKDRQSDLLSFLTVSPVVQQALKAKDVYSVIRVPEKILHYTENAKTQKPIILPISIKTNKNGDVFILDSGAACVHAYDTSDVAKSIILGKYKSPSKVDEKYAPNKKEAITGKDILFSDSLCAMDIFEDDLHVVDGARNEVIILRNCAKLLTMFSKYVYIINVVGCIALTRLNKTLILLCQTKKVLQVKGLQLELPKTKSAEFVLHPVEIFCFQPSRNLKDLFRFNFTGYDFGARTDDADILFYTIDDKSCTENASKLKSSITPSTSEGSIITYHSSSIDMWNANLSPVPVSAELAFSPVKKVITQSEPVAFSIWDGKLINVVGILGENYVVEEIGQLDFAVRFCEAVMRFYHAIGYVPPRGDKSKRELSIIDAITNGEVLAKLLLSMQVSLEKKFPTRKSFQREHGIPFTGTIECVQTTIKAWKGIAERLNFLKPGLHLDVYPHAVANEHLVENAFGFTMKKGQGHLQTQKEYAHSKKRVSVNFQLDMCDKPFHDYTKVKIRDKGYQEINPALKSKVNLDDLQELFQEDKKNKNDQEEKVEVSPEDKDIVHTAYLLSKSVPRQTNRCKWRERSGFTPNLLQEDSAGKLKVDDLVFHEMGDGSIAYFKVQKEIVLTNSTKSLDLVPVNSSGILNVSINKLMVHEGQIIAMPSYCYSEENGIVEFIDIAKEMFSDIYDQKKCDECFTDEEWSILFSSDGDGYLKEIDVDAKTVSLPSKKRNKERIYRGPAKREKIAQELAFNNKLATFWEELLPPAEEKVLKESWVAFIYAAGKKKNHLIFGRLKNRFLHDSDGTHLELTQWDIDCCKPYRVDSGTGIIEEIPHGEKPYTTNIHDIIFSYAKDKYKGMITYNKSSQWLVSNIEEVVDMFKGCLKIDMKKVFKEKFP